MLWQTDLKKWLIFKEILLINNNQCKAKNKKLHRDKEKNKSKNKKNLIKKSNNFYKDGTRTKNSKKKI